MTRSPPTARGVNERRSKMAYVSVRDSKKKGSVLKSTKNCRGRWGEGRQEEELSQGVPPRDALRKAKGTVTCVKNMPPTLYQMGVFRVDESSNQGLVLSG